jgi:hypothetical protein
MSPSQRNGAKKAVGQTHYARQEQKSNKKRVEKGLVSDEGDAKGQERNE